MKESQQRAAAKEFAAAWKDKGYEKGESQPFWLSLLRDVYGVVHPEQYISFEDQVHLDKSTGFIDGYIAKTKVLIEQKSCGKNLNQPIKQSNGNFLNPFQQAKQYITELPVDEHPRWVITCNFSEFWVYDMNRPHGDPEKILLSDLEKDYYRLNFLVEKDQTNIKREFDLSMEAGDLVKRLYDALIKQYLHPESEETLKSLNKLCVRLVFCLYAEDAGLFGKHAMFHDYIKSYPTHLVRKGLIALFQILNTKIEDRDPYLEAPLCEFPYVNGGLFADENIEIPQFTEEIVNILLADASEGFNWNEISPTIFGAVFESTLNPDTRRKGGMHYTSIENIHKVIDPLFLDDLKAELDEIKQIKTVTSKVTRLKDYQEKLSKLTFLDPACGSGNFLTETYLSLRHLENEVIELLIVYDQKQIAGQIMLGVVYNPIKVTISQFYGIEINDFAVSVAQTALWIAECQMMQKTEEIIKQELSFLPLTTNAYIVEGNALRMNWEDVVAKDELDYIMGNPPFVGFYLQNEEQKLDVKNITSESSLDYVACWYVKAAEYIMNTKIFVAFVSTNSICQGEQVALLWEKLHSHYKIEIEFAYTTFVWSSEASIKAAVHCVIIGFGCGLKKRKMLFEGDRHRIVDKISPYLIEGDFVTVKSRTTPLCNVPKLVLGNRPLDGKKLLLTEEEYSEMIVQNPKARKWIRPFLGATEFINNKKRYCLWLVGITPKELRELPCVYERVNLCREARLAATDKQMKKLADSPTLFREQKTSENDYIVLPRVSSSQRRYMPIGFVSKEVIAGDALQMIVDVSLYNFGVITSNVHMAWMRTVCGRMKSDYRYGKETVYNTFPWPNPTAEQKAKIEQTAQLILDARAKYPDASLADLYDDVVMPPELRKAHQANDKAVMQAYGFDYKHMTESECVAELMKLYQEMTKEK